METVTVTTHLNACTDLVWNKVNKPRIFLFVAHPVLRFDPVEPAILSNRWADGDYVLKLRWRGIVPLGKQVISISWPAAEGYERLLRDNGHSAWLRRWYHQMSVEPEGDGTRYTDSIAIDAGILTSVFAAFARHFLAHRQRRWHRLVKSGFNYNHP